MYDREWNFVMPGWYDPNLCDEPIRYCERCGAELPEDYDFDEELCEDCLEEDAFYIEDEEEETA